ncbi:MAG: hypothetical protein J2P43_06010 [Candidatus Dormibacteraeota bacterium]|nr:hypothetical protein [Candidatus Dormibacteraeota bacterium]
MSWSTVLSKAPTQRASSAEAPEPPDLEVVVVGVTSPLEADSMFGRGQGLLAADRSVSVTFLLGQQEFVTLRDKVLSGVTDVSLRVRAVDVTAVDLGAAALRPGALP